MRLAAFCDLLRFITSAIQCHFVFTIHYSGHLFYLNQSIVQCKEKKTTELCYVWRSNKILKHFILKQGLFTSSHVKLSLTPIRHNIATTDMINKVNIQWFWWLNIMVKVISPDLQWSVFTNMIQGKNCSWVECFITLHLDWICCNFILYNHVTHSSLHSVRYIFDASCNKVGFKW